MLARVVIAVLAGTLFGAGLAVSGMMNPAKVLAFLDVAGHWDPSLALVMAAAVAVATPAFRLAARRAHPVLAAQFQIPGNRSVDKPLLAGAALFGLGWGLVGLCPGPAVAVLTTGLSGGLLFFVCLIAGMALHRLLR